MLQKREKIMAIGVGVAAGIFVFNQFICSGQPKEAETSNAAPQTAATSGTAPAAATPPLNLDLIKNRQQRWQTVAFSDWSRNPFQAGRAILRLISSDGEGQSDSTAAGDSTQALTLNGLLWGVGEPVALIGDAILREGERQGDLQVVEIGPDYVLCRKGDKLHRLELDGPVMPPQRQATP